MNESRQAGLGGLPARYLLDGDNLARLWHEVHNFWASRNMVLAGSHFVVTGAPMIQQEPWFIEERSVAFASLLLTKRKDVIVRAHAGTDRAIDLLVEVLKAGKSALRFFGVQLVGSMDLPAIRDADERVLAHVPRDPSEAMLPVCVFVIGVRKPEGIYRWIVEPVVKGGQALLERNTALSWQHLDEAGVARLIGQVNGWYDVLHGDLTPPKGERRAPADA